MNLVWRHCILFLIAWKTRMWTTANFSFSCGPVWLSCRSGFLDGNISLIRSTKGGELQTQDPDCMRRSSLSLGDSLDNSVWFYQSGRTELNAHRTKITQIWTDTKLNIAPHVSLNTTLIVWFGLSLDPHIQYTHSVVQFILVYWLGIDVLCVFDLIVNSLYTVVFNNRHRQTKGAQ